MENNRKYQMETKNVTFTDAFFITYGIFLAHHASKVFIKVAKSEYCDLRTPVQKVGAGIVTFLTGMAGVYMVMNIVSSKQ